MKACSLLSSLSIRANSASVRSTGESLRVWIAVDKAWTGSSVGSPDVKRARQHESGDARHRALGLGIGGVPGNIVKLGAIGEGTDGMLAIGKEEARIEAHRRDGRSDRAADIGKQAEIGGDALCRIGCLDGKSRPFCHSGGWRTDEEAGLLIGLAQRRARQAKERGA